MSIKGKKDENVKRGRTVVKHNGVFKYKKLRLISKIRHIWA